MLKVNLIVVSGKPEGKVIPLIAPVFRIGRDETCHLRPNSVEVSRQHTEITISETAVLVKDLGSRNGTLVNGTLLNGSHRLKSGELLKVGPLTFAVSIQETAASAASANAWSPPASPKAVGGPQAQIESWLVADNARPTPDRPSGVYDGDTLTIDAYTGAGGQVPARPGQTAKPPSAPAQPTAKPASSPAQPVAARPASSPEQPVAKPPSAPAQATEKPPAPPTPTPAPVAKGGQRFDDENLEFDRLEEGAGDPEEETTGLDDDSDAGEESSEPEELIDESNPFYIPKPKKAKAEEPSKAAYKDTSDAANDILRKMFDRKRAGRS
jgi:predicted component of type VI protein secretion system